MVVLGRSSCVVVAGALGPELRLALEPVLRNPSIEPSARLVGGYTRKYVDVAVLGFHLVLRYRAVEIEAGSVFAVTFRLHVDSNASGANKVPVTTTTVVLEDWQEGVQQFFPSEAGEVPFTSH